MLAKFTSEKFRFWSFVCMACLVVVHGYNLHDRQLEPTTLPGEAMTLTAFIQYLLDNGILRSRTGMLSAISGYLYALHDHGINADRLRKRVRTLVVPYLLWSGLCLLLFYACETSPLGREWIAASRIARIHGTHLLVHEYTWSEWLIRWLLAPLPYQLWFLRALFACNLAYPLVKRWVTKPTSSRVFFALAVLVWLAPFSFSRFEAEVLLFFAAGVWMQTSGFDIERPSRWLNPLAWGVVFVAAATLKTWLAFAGMPTLLLPLHKLTTASGIIAVWFGGDALVRWGMRRPWFVRLTSFSFLIYVAHAPWVAILIDPVFALLAALGYGPGHRLLTFVGLPVVIIAAIVAFGAAFRKIAPAAYGLATGGRGL